MTKDELFAELFPLPYEHSKWLKDQAVLIERLSKQEGEFYEEQTKIMRGFQKDNQCSVLMLDILAERVERKINESLTTEESSVIINT